MALTVAYSGVDGIVSIAGTDMDVTKYDVKVADPGFDASTTAGAGWSDKLDSLRTVTGTFDFFYNTAKNPTGALLNLFKRPSVYPNVKLFVSPSTAGSQFLEGVAKILELSVKSEVTGGIMMTASFESRGTWALPV